ncbi:glycosyltransferase family 4 protein [Pseudarthrobacter sp. NPDC058119]|uniref:glycosyltransferase family 4 protein n=1 Tax=Pseudarthrobacter sp. NPDC058119 TaxID=3346348 RepID=UPI0036DCCCB7
MSVGRLRVLVVPNCIFFPPYMEDLRRGEASGAIPRSWINRIDADIEFLDQRLLTDPSKRRRNIYKHLPFWIVQVLEVYRVGRRYDVVFIWSVANVALILALLLAVSFRQITLVALLTRISEPKKALLLKMFHKKISKIILPPVVQREFATGFLRIPAEKFVDLPWTTDIEFWSDPHPLAPRNMICAAGGEMRDYRTLVEALRGLDIKCHIAGVLDTSRQDWWNVPSGSSSEEGIPTNVTFSTMSPGDLRKLYAASRIVVVPLKSTNSDNGITCINEAWSMGRPVIVSKVDGLRGTFVDGREGLWVEPGDVESLRTAITILWNDPEKASQMGAAGRILVERNKDNRIFAEGIQKVLSEAAGR